jgi:bifunctional UDP-N-acetylglucosamine pyrophosphorylase/glucosamine-1-phosphate N-acetyltransferase
VKSVEPALAAVILAAGQGTRMNSARAKVLHELAGQPLLHYPLAAAEALGARPLVVVVGRDADEVQRRFVGRARFVVQEPQRGTGHAVLEARSALADHAGDVLILYGDTPLLRPETLRAMRARKSETGAALVLLSSRMPLPGRVVRDARGRVVRIVEVTDASPDELAIEESNAGIYLLDAELLWKALAQVDDRNAQGEIYLTDIVERLLAEGQRVEALPLDDPVEGLGVNTRAELAQAAEALRRRIHARFLEAGVTLVDPAATWIDEGVAIGRDSVIEPGCVIRGATVIGERVHLKPHCVVESSRIGDECVIGPSAHLRAGTHLHRGVRIGNFVEVKNSELGEGVKADHLAYIGDADVGAGASFGCGAITVNYDWSAKHRTRVGAGATIGCNANLIAPVTIGPGAAVAAGSTVTQDVPGESLAVARARQRNVAGWRARRAPGRRPAPPEGGTSQE